MNLLLLISQSGEALTIISIGIPYIVHVKDLNFFLLKYKIIFSTTNWEMIHYLDNQRNKDVLAQMYCDPFCEIH